MMESLPSSSLSITMFILAAAFLMDFCIGDPRWLPHPVRQMGGLIERVEKALRPYLRSPRQERGGGVALVVVVLLVTLLAAWIATVAAIELGGGHYGRFVQYLAGLFLVYLTATTLALRELIEATSRVANLVQQGRLEKARVELGFIVGRDSGDLSPRQIQKALIETLGENLSDGVIAPLFYLALGGLPAALAYKAVNTMDSMVGYKNDRYRHFGWAAARLDDLLNYIPARVSALLIVIVAGLLALKPATLFSAWETMRTDGPKHASPNAGLPEAALAGALGVCLGGPAAYGGIMVEKPYLGQKRNEDYAQAVENAQRIVILAAFVFFLAVGAIMYVFN